MRVLLSSYVYSKEIVKSRTMAQKPVSLLMLAVGGGEGDTEREGLECKRTMRLGCRRVARSKVRAVQGLGLGFGVATTLLPARRT